MYKKRSNPAAIETQERLRLSLLKELKSKPLAQVKISELCMEAGVSRNGYRIAPEDLARWTLDNIRRELL